MNKSFIKKYGTLLLLAAGAGIIFQLPYIRDIVNIGLHFILKNVRPYAAPCSEA